MSGAHTFAELKGPLQKLYPELKRKYGVTSLGVFGSYVRAEQQTGSDLDLLVSFEEPPSLFQFIELENLISDTLSVKVDLVMEEAVKPNIKKRILEEVQFL